MSKPSGQFSIDLDTSRGPRAYLGDENLWRDDVSRIYRLLRHQISALDNHEQSARRNPRSAEKRYREPPHLSIAIFGPSGSGKSSLLRTLAYDIGRKDAKSILKDTPDLAKKVYSLPVIDPTTWSEADLFLYAFLATALEEEHDYQELHNQDAAPQGLSPAQLAFQNVNEYLRVVDDLAAPEEHDPLGMSLQKLERHTSGLRLRHALDKFIDRLADTFDSKLLLLPVDDLDMAPSHLVQSLQTYQSFLTHPRLVPVFTFTDRMSEELIEAHYERRLGDTQRHRLEGLSERLTISEQLAVQFLSRCFPVRNRIRLGPAPARLQRAIFGSRSRTAIRQVLEPKGPQPVLELLVMSSFLLFGYPDEEDAHTVRAALRPSTLRRQFQVVDAMADCRLPRLRIPQFAKMAKPTTMSDSKLQEQLEFLKTGEEPKAGDHAWQKQEEVWKDWPNPAVDQYQHRLGQLWHPTQKALLKKRDSDDSPEAIDRRAGFAHLSKKLYELKINATWATVFNGAVWSLLNVHRDTLRELGLFLEDLYSWSPKELRSVALRKILEQDQAVRRSVVDRWFHRTDFRRSQVLSLLAANVFRPWMTGEEPYGDEELPIRKQLELEDEGSSSKPLDDQGNPETTGQIRDRLTFRASEGLLWFINVTLGFYLPQIMARNWSTAEVSEPVKNRMSGNGWDLSHGPINAMRIADSKQEIFSFGMLFLGPRGYRHALESFGYEADTNEAKAWRGDDASLRGHLLLRIWSCCGYSRSRYWAAFSLWRGLGFIGQVLEVGLWERSLLKEVISKKNAIKKSLKRQTVRTESIPGSEEPSQSATEPRDPAAELKQLEAQLQQIKDKLKPRIQRLVRAHCLAGLVPGSLLDRDSDDARLLTGFPRWDPLVPDMAAAIERLVKDLVDWLVRCWEDRIFPLPAGDVWIGWRDCFIRRVHGEYILGAFWPKLNSAYLEERPRRDRWRLLARRRGYSEKRVSKALEDFSDSQIENLDHEEKFRWSAAVAAGAWSDAVLEYWRGCTPILRLLLTCPVFFKSQEMFGLPPNESADTVDRGKILRQLISSEEIGDLNPVEKHRYEWLERLSLPPEVWRELESEVWRPAPEEDLKIPGLVPQELAIERVRVAFFASRHSQHHNVSIDRTVISEVQDAAKAKPKDRYVAESEPVEYPKRPDDRSSQKS